MSVRLRLSRFGRIRRPFYRIGAFDSRSRRDGAALAYIGYYDPLETTGERLKLDKEAAAEWLAKGAQPTETVASFLRQEGVEYKKLAQKAAKNRKRRESRKKARAAKKA